MCYRYPSPFMTETRSHRGLNLHITVDEYAHRAAYLRIRRDLIE